MQTFRDFELIVINDGSMDTTALVLNAIDDPRVRVIHQDNAGSARAANRAIALATGRYIACLDHDDRAKLTRLEKQVAFLDANPDYALVGTRAEIWVGDQPTERFHDHPIDDAALRFEMLFDNYFVHSSVMLRKTALDAVGVYTTDKSRHPEDYELLSRIARRFRVANLPERLTIYREVESSISRALPSAARQDGVILVASENLAAVLGEPVVREVHKDIAALFNAAYHKLSPAPDINSMRELIQTAGARIAAGAPASDVPARIAVRLDNFRHHYANAHDLRVSGMLGT